MVYAKAGEKLYLSPELEDYAKEEQRAAMERDDREGLVQEYLDMLLPNNWDSMDVYKRRDYVRDADDPMRLDGSVRRMEVSNMEIWCECFGKPKAFGAESEPKSYVICYNCIKKHQLPAASACQPDQKLSYDHPLDKQPQHPVTHDTDRTDPYD